MSDPAETPGLCFVTAAGMRIRWSICAVVVAYSTLEAVCVCNVEKDSG